jgi:hypothetical protein
MMNCESSVRLLLVYQEKDPRGKIKLTKKTENTIKRMTSHYQGQGTCQALL